MVQKLKNLRKDGEGFTIIEVLIVLAIAGLILLIVFLAVPALQRNSRNTTRKNEVSGILGALNEATNNNNGKLPTTCGATMGGANANGNSGNLVTASTAANDCNAVVVSATTFNFLSNAKTNFYTTTSIGFDYSAGARAGAVPDISDPSGIMIFNYLKCNGSAATKTGASQRSVVALYGVESGNKDVSQCVESGS